MIHKGLYFYNFCKFTEKTNKFFSLMGVDISFYHADTNYWKEKIMLFFVFCNILQAFDDVIKFCTSTNFEVSLRGDSIE